MPRVTLEKVGPENLARCGIGCLADPKHIGHPAKVKNEDQARPAGTEERLRSVVVRQQVMRRDHGWKEANSEQSTSTPSRRHR